MKGQLLIALAFLIVISTGFSTLTSNKIAYASNSTLVILDKTANTTTSILLNNNISSISLTEDGLSNLIITTYGAPSKVYVYTQSGTLITSFTTTNASTGFKDVQCVKSATAYYCRDYDYARVRVYDLTGALTETQTNTTGSARSSIWYSSTYDKIYQEHYDTNFYVANYVPANMTHLSSNASTAHGVAMSVSPRITQIIGGLLEVVTDPTTYYYNLDANGNATTLNTSVTCSAGDYCVKTSTGSYLSQNGTHLIEDDGVTQYSYPADIDYPYIAGAQNYSAYRYVELTDTVSSSGQEGQVQFVMDWNQNGIYESNSGNYSYNGFTNDWTAPYLNVTIKTGAGTTVGSYVTDENGYITPTLNNNTFYYYLLQYAETNVTRSGTFLSNTINRFLITNTVMWLPYGQEANGGRLSGVTFTFYNSATPSINQTKIGNTYTAFYTVVSGTNYYSISASKTGYSVTAYYNNNKTGSYADVKAPWALFGSQNFFITDIRGVPYTTTAYSSGDTEGVTSNNLISKIKFKIFDASTGGFLTSKDFTEGGDLLPYVSITDSEGVCNEESLNSATVTVTNWADYSKYVGIPSACSYKNDNEGERIECPSTTVVPYAQFLRKYEWSISLYRYYFVGSFSVPSSNALKIIKVSGTENTFCLSQGKTGTCYLNYVCTKGTTNTLVASIIRNSKTYALKANVSITQGVITMPNDAWVKNGTTQTFNIPVSFGQTADLTSVACTANITYADASTALYTLTPYADGAYIRYWALLTGATGAQRSEVSYVYNVSCSGGNYATVIDEGTAYVSKTGFDLKASPFCNVIPSTFPNSTAPMLYCEVRTSEATAPIAITADVDMGVGANATSLPLNKTIYLQEDSAYLRVYRTNTYFQNAPDGSYTVTFTLNGNTNYSNMTFTVPITVDSTAGTTTIDSVEFDKARITDNDTVTCTAVFSGSNFNSAQVDVWSQEYKADNTAGTLSNGSYEMWNHKFTTYGSDYAPTLQKIGADKYQISYSFLVSYCDPEDYECFTNDALIMKTSDTLWCNWRVNYAEKNVSTSFVSSGASGDVKWVLTNFPFNLFAWIVGLLLNPFVFIVLLLVLAFLFAMKRG